MKSSKPPSDYGILAIMFIAFCLGIWAYYGSPTNRYYNPANQHQSTAYDGDSHAVTPMPEKIDSVTKTTKPYTAEEKEKFAADRSDLAAQWATARYTFVGLVLGGLGLFFIIVTVQESRKAAYFTQQALSETKSNSRKELRAYIHVVPYALNLNSTEDVPTVVLRIFNKGQTPALNISCDISAEEDGAETVSDSFPCKVSIPPNSHEDIIWPLEDSDMTKTWGIKIYFLTKYNDIFGNNRFVNIGVDVFDSSFPNSEPVLFQRNWITGGDSYGRSYSNPQEIPFKNPRFESEVIIPFVSYGDDLQQEAKEYAEANKTS